MRVLTCREAASFNKTLKTKDGLWPEPSIRVAEICTNPMAAYWF